MSDSEMGKRESAICYICICVALPFALFACVMRNWSPYGLIAAVCVLVVAAVIAKPLWRPTREDTS